MSFLSASHLTKRYKRGEGFFKAVDDATFSLDKGRLLAVVGRSGSGKTTLLSLLAGLIEPDGGEVVLGGVSLFGLGDGALSSLRSRKIGFVPQGRSLLGNLTAVDNVRLPHHLAGRPGPSLDRAMELMRELGVDHLAGSRPQSLSGGELRRVALARSLMNSPELIIADEPTSDLDEEAASSLMDALRKLADAGAAIAVATHDRLAAAKADLVLTMRGGALGVEEGA
ncbi:MAG: ATP-binding cassette domain-containing protein [Deltaproteobacteria bacterium]|jgi:putative ABC transport system ATP-binding protein|nr:ATP-binding cassette domain-containing protein [Deltaproteobacteria bacterium]